MTSAPATTASTSTPTPSPTLADPSVSVDEVVLIWRDSDSPRLRTYVDPHTQRPISCQLPDVFPPANAHLTTVQELDHYLLTAPPPDGVIAISVDLARTVLGWDPTLPSPVT